jgi:integrase
VTGKGNRARAVYFTPGTAQALARYERLRREHAHGSSDRYWIGSRGPLTDSGITQVLRGRAAAAGIEHLHPHMLRHTWAHRVKSLGMVDEELKELGGWRSDQMLQRYGAAVRSGRARTSYERLAPDLAL